MELTPIKVRIAFTPNGYQYPDFGKLDVVVNSGVRWEDYLKAYGVGWLYDRLTSAHEETEDSPFGTWFGVYLVPEEFAEQAVSEFSDTVEELSESQMASWYEGHITHDAPDEILDLAVLQAIVAKQSLGLELTKGQQQAIDAADSTPGIVSNARKSWSGYRDGIGLRVVGRRGNKAS